MDEDTRIINYCTCCPFWKRSPSLVFDYSEIDDAEFESQFTSSMATPLLSNHRHTPTLPQPTQSLHSLTLSSSALVSPGIWTGFASLFRGSTARGLHPHHHHHHHHTQHQHQHIQSSGRAGRQIPPPASLSLSLEDGGGSGRGYLGVASDARLLSREEVDSLTSSYLQQDQMEISSKGGLASLVCFVLSLLMMTFLCREMFGWKRCFIPLRLLHYRRLILECRQILVVQRQKWWMS